MSVSTQMSIQDKMTARLNKISAAFRRTESSVKAADDNIRQMERARDFGASKAQLAAEKAEQMRKKQEEIAAGGEKIASAWGGIKSMVGAAVAAMGVRKAAEMVDSYARGGARLALINDGLQSQAELQNMVYRAAQRSRGVYTDMLDVTAKLGMLAGDAFSGNAETVRFAELMQKSFAVSGASGTERQAAMYQLTQAMAAGKLQGDEFRSIMENAPMLAQAIAEFTGKSKAELKQMSADGVITADIIKGAMFSAADGIEEKFEKLPKTFSDVWNQICNFAVMRFGGVMERINGFLNSETGAALVGGVLAGVNLIASVVEWLFNGIQAVGSLIQASWGVIQPILIGIGAALAYLAVTQIPILVGKLWAMVAPVLAQAAAWALVNWPILLIIGLIALLAYNLAAMGVTFSDVCGGIGAVLGGLYAFGYNLVADAWNLLATFAEFFANVFNDPVGAVARLFFGVFDSILGIVETVAGAIDALVGSDMSGAVAGFRSNMQQWVDDKFGESQIKIDRMEKLDTGDTAKAWGEKGVAFADGMDGMLGALSLGEASFGGEIPDVGNVGSVGKVEQDINIAEEDLKFLRDVAEMRYVQNFVTLTPTVAMNASISEKVDVNVVVAEIERKLEEEFAAEAEGVYA